MPDSELKLWGWIVGCCVAAGGFLSAFMIQIFNCAKKSDVYDSSGDNKFITVHECETEMKKCNESRDALRTNIVGNVEKDTTRDVSTVKNDVNLLTTEVIELKNFRRATDERIVRFETAVVNMTQHLAEAKTDMAKQIKEFKKDIVDSNKFNNDQRNTTIDNRFNDLIKAVIGNQ